MSIVFENRQGGLFVLLLTLCSLGLLSATGGLAGQGVPGAQPRSAGRGFSGANQVVLEDRSGDMERIVRTLVQNGFENVSVFFEGDRLLARFENARFRDDRRALSTAHTLVASALEGETRELVLIPLHRGIPIFAARTYSSITADRPTLARAQIPDLPDADPASRSFGRVDLVLHPWIEASFGDYGNPVASRLGVAPELRTALRPGLVLSGQVLLTIQDDLPGRESRIRPGSITLSQLARVGPHAFVSAAAGTFTDNRYGLSLAARAISVDGRFSAGVEVGQTGEASYTPGRWQRTPMRDRTALVDASAYVPAYDLTVRATTGVFLEEDQGLRLDVVRRFGELDVGIFGVIGGHGNNGGVHLRVPLAPAKHGSPRPVRVRVADALDWEYRYLSLFSSGRHYRVRHSTDEAERLSRLPQSW